MTYTIEITESSPKAKSIIEMFKMLALDYDFLQISKTNDNLDFMTEPQKENSDFISEEHKNLLNSRLEKIERGETTFESWDTIKQKYEKNAV